LFDVNGVFILKNTKKSSLWNENVQDGKTLTDWIYLILNSICVLHNMSLKCLWDLW